ncbi:MAG: ABC transporter permease subunit [Zymomonas mobilis]|uniref:NitT/TauT family transport system permease protein n=1 Tax=Zymomonas mobilis TaxID=542 RepID=A0A542W0D7_ZYMMB|nr:ABC transporter permease subunit [Zymomonas mobilis]TQL17045.1 NitT/TauT family transport system permease protein [Zymomonas mobilis]
MVFLPHNSTGQRAVAAFARIRILPNIYDLIAFVLLGGAIALVVHGTADMSGSLAILKTQTISLKISHLPEYALRTTLRMFAGILVSLIFTFVVATFAAKNSRAGQIIVPAMDILQSVPVLGFLTFTVTFFLGLFPGQQIGAEFASIFAIFTSQVWNMAFSFYQSLTSIPTDLDEACRSFKLSAWQRFWRLEAPFAAPGLIWNTMMSMSGGWFFVVASEAITVGNTDIRLPGIGSYLALAIDQKNFSAIGAAVLAMVIIIVLYNQLLFRPILAWADKFKLEQSASKEQVQSWVYDIIRHTRLMKRLSVPFVWIGQQLMMVRFSSAEHQVNAADSNHHNKIADYAWFLCVLGGIGWGCWVTFDYLQQALSWGDVWIAFTSGLMTLLRVVVLIVLASLIWVPVGIWIGLRPALAQRIQPIAQFLAAFPANVLFPFVVIAIVVTGANPNIWLSPLIILGTQWYILFNVIAGAASFPTDLKEAVAIYQIRSWTWWRRVMLPGIFPYYITGALTATGGSWNASIVAEVASWGNTQLEAYGLGAYIANATTAGDVRRVVLGIVVMAFFVTFFNRILWRPLYVFAERRIRFN